MEGEKVQMKMFAVVFKEGSNDQRTCLPKSTKRFNCRIDVLFSLIWFA